MRIVCKDEDDNEAGILLGTRNYCHRCMIKAADNDEDEGEERDG